MGAAEDAENARRSRVMAGDLSDDIEWVGQRIAEDADRAENDDAPHPTPAPEDAGGGEGAGLLPAKGAI